eukprot:4216466-Amphidinium_carterae.1
MDYKGHISLQMRFNVLVWIVAVPVDTAFVGAINSLDFCCPAKPSTHSMKLVSGLGLFSEPKIVPLPPPQKFPRTKG